MEGGIETTSDKKCAEKSIMVPSYLFPQVEQGMGQNDGASPQKPIYTGSHWFHIRTAGVCEGLAPNGLIFLLDLLRRA